MTTQRLYNQILFAIIIGLVVGCLAGSIVILVFAGPPLMVAFLPGTPTPTETATPLPTITLAPLRTTTFTRTLVVPSVISPAPTTAGVTPRPSLTVTATGSIKTATATKSPIPTRTPRPFTSHLIVGRPVALNVVLNSPLTNPDRSYLYGTTQKGDYDVHHGEEFVNPTGTGLYAVANGTVVTAGSDDKPICGEAGKTVCGATIYPGRGFYGKLVVIQLAQSYQGQRIFALYGHMNKISVKVGDQVAQGDPIGEVGMSGIADGPHVHFEIRIGTNDYGHTRNPILWMTPIPGRGSMAGRYTDAKGNVIRGAIVSIYRADGTYVVSVETYSRDKYPEVNSDDELGENFAMSDLPSGDYTIRVNGQPYVQRVTIQDGKLSFVDFGGPS